MNFKPNQIATKTNDERSLWARAVGLTSSPRNAASTGRARIQPSFDSNTKPRADMTSKKGCNSFQNASLKKISISRRKFNLRTWVMSRVKTLTNGRHENFGVVVYGVMKVRFQEIKLELWGRPSGQPHVTWRHHSLFRPLSFLSLHFWNATFPLLPSLIDGACVIANDVIARVRPSASCHDCQTVREQTASSSLHAVGTEIRIGLWDAAALQLLLPPPLYMCSCCKNCDIMTTFTEKALSLLWIPLQAEIRYTAFLLSKLLR